MGNRDGMVGSALMGLEVRREESGWNDVVFMIPKWKFKVVRATSSTADEMSD